MEGPEPTNSFGPVAPYYDELMKPVPYRMWTGYYLLLLAQQEIKPMRVLDVACGTGTMCEMLTREGLILTGFDLSQSMIEEATRKARRKGIDVRYEVADATDFELRETYEAAFSFFDSLNNILEPGGLPQVFQRVYEHLEPGGSWIFDLNTPYAFEAELFNQESGKRSGPLKYKWTSEYDAEAMLCTVDMRFVYKGEPFREVHRQRAHRTEDVVEWLEEAGFVDVRTYHSYTLDRPRAKSDRIHFCAIRP